MATSSQDLTIRLPGTPAAGGERLLRPAEIERLVMEMFDESRNPLLRYVLSLGVPTCYGEEIVQEVFLALFRHLQLGRPRENLRGWIFRVAHNLALKQFHLNYRLRPNHEPDRNAIEHQCDPDPNPEERILESQRQERLRAAVKALPRRDRWCLHLRAEGLRYREIARILGMSLGAVSISLTRSFARLGRADRESNHAER